VAAAGQTEFALMHAPIGLIAGQTADPDEYTLNATLRAKLASQMASLTGHWPSQIALQTRTDASELSAQTVALYGLIRRHRLRAAGDLYDRTISPLSDAFNTRLTRAQAQLNADTNGADHRAVLAALGVAAGAGILLVLLFLSIALVLRRLDRADLEERVLAVLATTDSLTGVPNHRALMLAIRTEAERARRYDRPFAVLFLDVDHFKQVNDDHGHAAGDMTLAAFASLVAQTLRSSDTFGRWGGEEFLAILPETDHAAAIDTAERIRTAISQHDFASTGGHRVTCSIGIAVCPDDAGEFTALIAAADRAMYTAKQRGRDQWAAATGLFTQGTIGRH